MSYIARNIALNDPVYVSNLGSRGIGPLYHAARCTVPSSVTLSTGNRAFYYPFFVSKPYSLARWFWSNGATVGTDRLQIGIYDEDFVLFRASPFALSAGTASHAQYVNPGIAGHNVTASSSNTDATTYTTASVTLKAGVLYLMSVENSHGSSATAVSSIDNGPTFTSRSTTQFNTNLNRVSIWSAVPTVDYTGTLVINFGATTQTGAVWSLNAFYHVDTASSDGIVQNATGTGNSTTPLATLAAFGSSANATFGAFGAASGISGTPSSGYMELSDNSATTPAQALQTDYRPDNDTTVDETITSAQWGACAVEIKSLGTGALAIPPMRGYLGLWCSGTTATVLLSNSQNPLRQHYFLESSLTTGLKTTATPTGVGASGVYVLCGFTSRSSP